VQNGLEENIHRCNRQEYSVEDPEEVFGRGKNLDRHRRIEEGNTVAEIYRSDGINQNL